MADSYVGGGYDDYAPVEAPVDVPAAGGFESAPPSGGNDFGGFDPNAYMAQREAEVAANAAAVSQETATEPEPDAGFGFGAPVDEATANELSDALSVFGGGIKFSEV